MPVGEPEVIEPNDAVEEAEELWKRIALLDSAQNEPVVIGERWSSHPEPQEVAQQNVRNAPNSSHESRIVAGALSHLNASKQLKIGGSLSMVVGIILVEFIPVVAVVAFILAPVLIGISAKKIKNARKTLEHGILY